MTSRKDAEATQENPWTRASEAYNQAVGRATKKGALELVQKTNARLPFIGSDVRIIDLGAGTGSMTLTLAEAYPDAQIMATDISEGMLSQLRKARTSQLAASQDPTKNHVSVRVLDIQDACGKDGEPEGAYTHALSTFVIEQISNPQAAVNSMFSLLRPNSGSVAAIGQWDYSRQCDPHAVWEEAAAEVEPSYQAPPRNFANTWESREDFEEGMRRAGFENVQGELFKCRFDSGIGVDGFMDFFWNNQNPNPYATSRMESWPGDLQPVKDAMRRIVEERIRSGKGLWTDMGLIVGTKP